MPINYRPTDHARFEYALMRASQLLLNSNDTAPSNDAMMHCCRHKAFVNPFEVVRENNADS